ncbi:MAG: hypothetical protein ABIO70_30775 [Pseudomonadota bacterium]
MVHLHVTWSAEGRHPLFPDEALRRRAVRKLAEVARESLTVFCLVDEHVHAALMGEPEVLRRRMRAITRSMRGLAVVSLDGPRQKVIQDRAHMKNVVDYVLRQPEHHELPVHSALWSGGCFPDLVGARIVPDLRLRLCDALPRYSLRDAFEAVGLPPRRLEEPGPEALRLLGAGALFDAACAALCVVPRSGSHTPDEAQARRTAHVLAREIGLPLSTMAAVAQVGSRSARRLASEPLPAPVRRAVLLRLALEAQVQALPPAR